MLFKELDKILMQVQKPSQYIGGELNSVVKTGKETRFAFCFPDVYEIGMSHLGMKILYSLKNAREDIWCERVFAPAKDMEQKMREKNIPLYALESLEPISNFDMIGFTLQYELSFPNVLNMLDLAGLPIKSADRQSLSPIVIAGGPCACNPEPLADFIDLFVLGEGEEVNIELIELYQKAKIQSWTKKQFLLEAAQIDGIYVPQFYTVDYNEDNTVKSITTNENVPKKITKRIIKDLDKVFFPENFIVPFTETVHDRAIVEVLRGCIRGCRFCQAGFIYRPFREKSIGTINNDAKTLCDSTGYDEVSLSSLSTSDYSNLDNLFEDMTSWSEKDNVSIALPSLRVDNFSNKTLHQIAKVRKTGLTFAPEAGTQRMRNVINKNVTEEQILNTCRIAFDGGYTSVKLYFMIGLPTETPDDIIGINHLAAKIVQISRQANVTASVACFVPKPFTPFQFEPQSTMDELKEKQHHLLSVINKRVKINYHARNTSVIEGVLARGDRRLCAVIETAWKNGVSENTSEIWFNAMTENNISPDFYANRKREYTEIMPWDHLDFGVSKEYLISENKKAHENVTTENCKEKCSGCQANKLIGGACFK